MSTGIRETDVVRLGYLLLQHLKKIETGMVCRRGKTRTEVTAPDISQEKGRQVLRYPVYLPGHSNCLSVQS